MITRTRPVITHVDELDLLPDGTLARLVPSDAGAPALCVVKLGGEVHALADRCPHRGVPLSTGVLVGTDVVCLAHGRRFDLRSGLSGDGRSAPATSYTVVIRGGVAETRIRKGRFRLLSRLRRS